MIEGLILIFCILGCYTTYQVTKIQRLKKGAIELLQIGVPPVFIGQTLRMRELFRQIPKKEKPRLFHELLERHRKNFTEDHLRKLLQYYD